MMAHMSGILLFAFAVCLLSFAAYLLIVTDMTSEERDEMMRDEELWP